MNKIDFFSLFLPALEAYGSKSKAGDTPQDLSMIKAARVVQSINDINHSLVLILLLVTVIFVALFGLLVFLIVRRLIRIGRAYGRLVSASWIDDPDVHLRKAEDPDLSLGMFTEQQWLFNQFLSQGHEDADAHDLLDISHDWWS